MSVKVTQLYVEGLLERADKIEEILKVDDPHESYSPLLFEVYGLIGYIGALRIKETA